MLFDIRPALAAAWLSCAALVAGPCSAQERYSPFVPSEQGNVERMLRLAGIRDGDVIIDLGSGDGRIVLTAARTNPTVRGIGVDLDEKLVEKANADAKAEGLADRVRVEVHGAPPALVDVTHAAVTELGVDVGAQVWLSAKATEMEAYAEGGPRRRGTPTL